MSFPSMLKRAITNACFGFCVLTLLYSLVMIGVYNTEANMSVFTVLLFYPLCFSISFVNCLLQKSSASPFGKAILRYFAFLVSIGLFICLPHKEAITSSVLVILFFIITVLYVLTSLIYAWLFSGRKTKNGNDTEYVNVYKTTSKK